MNEKKYKIITLCLVATLFVFGFCLISKTFSDNEIRELYNDLEHQREMNTQLSEVNNRLLETIAELKK